MLTLRRCLLLAALVLLVSHDAMLAPVDPKKQQVEENETEKKEESQDTGLHYDSYLQEVVRVLETDPEFKKKLQEADIEDIKSGKLSAELNLVAHNVRSQLDELKRTEVTRLRKLQRVRMDMQNGRNGLHQGDLRDVKKMYEEFNHVDHSNPRSFEEEDLNKLIQAVVQDLENYDQKRHLEFKRYEMVKEHQRREKLSQLSEEDRKKEQERYEEMQRKHKDHPKMNHPGSKDQLEEVWEADGLAKEDFNPRAFFGMHDTNGDGYLDPMELEALFEKELEKVYKESNEEDDLREMEEERARMRKHVLREVDTNKDSMVSFEEFSDATKRKEFEQPEEDSFEPLDETDFFTEEELEEFEQQLAREADDLRQKEVELARQRAEHQQKRQQLQQVKMKQKQVVQMSQEQERQAEAQGQQVAVETNQESDQAAAGQDAVPAEVAQHAADGEGGQPAEMHEPVAAAVAADAVAVGGNLPPEGQLGEEQVQHQEAQQPAS
ncbi:PREDICTED: nucleobindin-2-like isoform X1 [Branchiostoma belcheri]|uniref:Nucleobindin-2-like isoform X1 n=1 Tax=Branchiostoma belcheri TaxID=7741 RepID=A0A6P4ZFL9_BRABE|nr:PREDICTED: nucleobindin-2-like isoform X1 [Branchiostoma belcheri]